MSGEYEKVDRTPVEMPTRLRLPQSRTDQIRAFIRHELSQKAQEQGFETFEEADDIEPDDEEGELPYSPYEQLTLEPPSSSSLSTAPGPNAKPGLTAEGGAPADPAPSTGEGTPHPTTPEAPHGPK